MLHFIKIPVSQSLVIVGVFLLFFVSSLVAQEPKDVSILRKEYYKQCDEVREKNWSSVEEHTAWYQDWLDRMLVLLDKYKNQEEEKQCGGLISDIIGLANGVDNFELSAIMIDKLLNLRDMDPFEKCLWLVQKGTAYDFVFNKTRKPEDQKSAIEALQAAIETAKIACETKNRTVDQFSDASTILVISYQMLGRIGMTYTENSKQLPYEKIALEALENAYKYLSELLNNDKDDPNIERRLLSTSRELAKAYAKMKKNEECFRTINSIAKLKSNRFSLSNYAIVSAQAAYFSENEGRANFLIEWLNNKERPKDDYDSIVKARIGHAFFYANNYAKAKEYYVPLVDQLDHFMKYQEQAFLIGRGGDYALVLDNLSIIYNKEGNKSESLKYKEMFVDLFPKYTPLVNENEEIIERLQKEITAEKFETSLKDFPRDKEPFWSPGRIMILSVNLVVLIVLCFFMYKRIKTWHSSH